MRQRSSWKEHAAAVGAAAIEGRKVKDYPQTSAALDLWARSNAIRGMKWMSPEVRYAEYGQRIGRARAGIDEIEERVEMAVTALPVELRGVVQLHHAHMVIIEGRILRVHHEVTVAERARRFLNMSKAQYYDLLAAGYFHIAGWLGYDGR